MLSNKCCGCKISNGLKKVQGGTISLGEHWLTNHYQDPRDRFLGWLVVQPRKHRMSSSGMTKEELQEFGVQTRRLERALIEAYDKMHPNDRAQIVYLVRFAESTLETKSRWHLHWHMLPRTSSMKKKCVLAWDIEKCRLRLKKNPSVKDIRKLMRLIESSLSAAS